MQRVLSRLKCPLIVSLSTTNEKLQGIARSLLLLFWAWTKFSILVTGPVFSTRN
jgi:hypothetical protein